MKIVQRKRFIQSKEVSKAQLPKSLVILPRTAKKEVSPSPSSPNYSFI